MVAKVFGAIIIFIAIMMYILSLANLNASVQTDPGTPLENVSLATANIYSIMEFFIAVLPYVMFSIGFGVMLKGT